MAYDPRRDRPRTEPGADDASVVDTLLDGSIGQPRSNGHDPAPADFGPVPEPPQTWSERLLYSVGISTVLGAALGLVALGWLWKAWRRRRR